MSPMSPTIVALLQTPFSAPDFPRFAPSQRCGATWRRTSREGVPSHVSMFERGAGERTWRNERPR